MKRSLGTMKRLSLMALFSVGLSHSYAQTTTFNFTGGIQTYTVPCGIDTVYIQAWGAQGGLGDVGGASVAGGQGGLGGYSEGYLLVTPGDVLNIFVGGQGATPTGGFNGGANGGSTNAGGGGGASDVRKNGTTELDRVITAGGGGGGGRAGCDEGSASTAGIGGAGGFGGGGIGTNGNDSPTSGGLAGGGFGGNFGAVQGGLGAKGIGCPSFSGSDGFTTSNGNGGTGGSGQSCCCSSSQSIPGGGGGGGGQIGGGGGGGGSAGTVGCSGNSKGAGGGGGGGSSYVGGVVNSTISNGIWIGNGQVSITIPDLTPVASLNQPTNQFCVGDTIDFTASSTNNGTVYTWSVSGDLTIVSGQGTNTVSVVGSGATNMGTIEVAAQDVVCNITGPATTPFTVLVNALPTVAASASDAALCAGESVTLTASGADSYSWDNSVVDNTPFTPNVTATYTVTGTDVNGCVNTASTQVVVNSLPTVALTASMSGTVCGGQDIQLAASPAGGTLTMASGNAAALTGSVFNATTPGAYVVEYNYTDANGCAGSDTLQFSVNCFLGIELAGTMGSISVYPNPAQGTFSLKSPVAITGTVELFDDMGRIVFSQTVNNTTQKQFELKNIIPAVYTIKITNGTEISTGKLQVVK